MARLPDTFEASDDPAAPPMHPLGLEIEALRASFAALGVNADHAVPLWLGKPNRFTGQMMTAAQHVLDYMHAEFAYQRSTRTTPEPGAPGPQVAEQGRAEGVVSTVPADPPIAAPGRRRSPEAQERAAMLARANAAWREAVQQRADAVRQWDQYVAHLREQYRSLKLQR